MFQIKEENKTPEEELSKVEISNLPNKYLKLMIIEITQETREKNG